MHLLLILDKGHTADLQESGHKDADYHLQADRLVIYHQKEPCSRAQQERLWLVLVLELAQVREQKQKQVYCYEKVSILKFCRK